MILVAIILFLTFASASADDPFSEEGKATYYADSFQGVKTASGEKYDRKQLTAAHATLPLNTYVCVTNLRNGKSITVRINDRMRKSPSKVIDLSREAAARIGLVAEGIGSVKIREVGEETTAPVPLPHDLPLREGDSVHTEPSFK